MATPLLLYKFDEASSGTTPTVVHDTSAGTAANATITYGASATWISVAAGDGFNHSVGGFALTASLGGTKVQTAMAGSTTATVQLVIDANGGGGNIFVLYASNLDEIISLAFDSGNAEMDVTLANSAGDYGVGRFTLPTTGIFVITILIDTTQTGTAVVQGYLGTTLLNTRVFTAIPVGTALDAGESWTAGNGIRLSIGNNPATSQATMKTFFAALYSSVLGTTQINANATALATNNDADPNGTGVSVALTGMAATTGRGTMVPAWSGALTGQAATSGRGTLVPGVAPPLTGAATTAGRGTMVPAVSAPLTGQAATGTGGTVTPPGGGGTAALTGQQLTVSGGTMTPAIGVPLTGAAATSGRGTMVPAVAPPLTGQAAASAGGAASPAIAAPLTGQAATSGRGTVTPAISVSLTGNSATSTGGGIFAAIARALTGLFGTAQGGNVSSGFVPVQTLRPPFTATVDAYATTVVPGAQQLTAVVDAQSLTVDGDT